MATEPDTNLYVAASQGMALRIEPMIQKPYIGADAWYFKALPGIVIGPVAAKVTRVYQASVSPPLDSYCVDLVIFPDYLNQARLLGKECQVWHKAKKNEGDVMWWTWIGEG